MNKVEAALVRLGYEYEEVIANDGNPKSEIYLVRNFIVDSEVHEVLKIIGNASEDDWTTHYMGGVKALAERKYQRTDIDNLVKEGLIEITTHWIDKNLGLPNYISEPITERVQDIFDFDPSIKLPGIGTIQRQYEGAPLIEHVDNHSDPSIEYAVIIYINDDYSDGELVFPEMGIEIKPAAKSLLIFPAGERYLHGVKPPGKGPLRYVLPSFVRKMS